MRRSRTSTKTATVAIGIFRKLAAHDLIKIEDSDRNFLIAKFRQWPGEHAAAARDKKAGRCDHDRMHDPVGVDRAGQRLYVTVVFAGAIADDDFGKRTGRLQVH
jgi:hypothetical protein